MLWFTILKVAALIVFAGGVIAQHFRKRRESWPVLALGVGALVIGLLFGQRKSDDLQRLREQRQWPTVAGKVVESKITGVKAISPQVVYEYSVAGSVYRNESALEAPGFGNAAKRQDAAEKLIAEYPVGRAITVYYRGENPAESVLNPNAPWNVYMQLGIWIFLMFGGVVVVIGWGYRRQ